MFARATIDVMKKNPDGARLCGHVQGSFACATIDVMKRNPDGACMCGHVQFLFLLLCMHTLPRSLKTCYF